MVETLEEFMRSVSAAIDPIFAQTGQILPMYHIVAPIGETVIPAPPVADKDVAVQLIRLLLEKVEASRVCFVDEAWTVTRKGTADDLEQMRQMAPPSEQSDRKEIVMFSVEDIAKGELLGYRDIIREPGQRPRLGELVIHERVTMSVGRMVGLLPRPAGARVQ